MKRILLFFNCLLALNLIGQTITGTPSNAYTVAVTNNSNAFYSNASGYNKFQFIYTNSELFDFNASIPSGTTTQLDQLWFKHGGSTIPPFSTLSNFKITLGHSNSTPGALSTTYSSNFSSAPVTCFSSTSFIYTVSGTWAGINLTTPFVYDGVSNLCVQIEYTASVGSVASNLINTAFQTLATNLVTNVTGTTNVGRPVIGFGTGTSCPIPNFSLPNDTVVCGTAAITLNAPSNVSSGFTYQWIRKPLPTSLPAAYVPMGNLASQLTTTTTATYILVVSDNPFTCSRLDSITVTFGIPAPSFTLGPDILFCGLPPSYNNTTQLKPIPLITPTAGLTFQWTGITLPPAAPGPIVGIPTAIAQMTTPTGAGQYILTVTKGLCKTRDTINLVSPVPKFTLPNDTTVCNGVALTINAPSTVTIPPLPGYTVSWFSHPFASAASPTPLGSGASVSAPLANLDHYYVLVVTSPAPGSCTKKDSIRVRYNTGGIPFTLINDTFFCKTPNIIQLKPNVPITPTAGLTFTWTALDLFANTPVVLIPAPANLQTYTPTTNPGRYILKVTTAVGCVTRDTVKLFDRSVPVFLLPNDTSLCAGQSSLTINVPLIVSTTPPYTYNWYQYPVGSYSSGSNISVNNSVNAVQTAPPLPLGQFYTLTVANGFCTRKDSMKVRFGGTSAVFSLIPDTFYCGTTNNVIVKPLSQIIPPVTSPATVYNYQWTGTTIAPATPGLPITGAALGTSPMVQATTPIGAGQYVLTVTNVNNGCKFSDTVIVRNRRMNSVTFADKDTSVCTTTINSITLTAPSLSGPNLGTPYTYNWIQHPFATVAGAVSVSTTNTAIATNVFTNHFYVLNVSNGFCVTKDSVRVRFGLPTAFSLINDTFYCGTTNNIQIKPSVPLPTVAAPVNIYQWTGITIPPAAPGNIAGAALGTPTQQATTPTGAGQYTLNYTNPLGCKSTDVIIVRNRRVNSFNFAPKDTSLCNGQSTYNLIAPSVPSPNNGAPNPYTYIWVTYPFGGNSATGTQISTFDNTVAPDNLIDNYYHLKISNGYCSNVDSVRVRYGKPTPFTLGNDTFFCKTPNTVQLFPKDLNPPPAGLSYLWTGFSLITPFGPLGITSPANVQNALTPANQGNYVLTVTNAKGCKYRDEIKLFNKFLANINLGTDKLVCNKPNSAVVLIKPANVVGPAPFTWQWQQVLPNVTPLEIPDSVTTTVFTSGSYALTYSNGFCKVSDTIKVTYADSTKFDLGPDTFFCTNPNLLKLKPIDSLPSVNIKWVYTWTGKNLISSAGIPLTPALNGCTTQILSPTLEGIYTLVVKNEAGCFSKDIIKLNNYKVAPTFTTLITNNPGTNPKDTILCNATSYPVRGPDLPANASPFIWSYAWYKKPNINSANVLSTTQFLVPTATGTGSGEYILFVSNNKCNDSDKINIVFSSNPVVNLGSDDTLCSPFIKTLSGPNAPAGQTYIYTWSQGSNILSSTQTYNTANAGTYTLAVNNQYGCKNIDNIVINARTINGFNLGNDTGTCRSNSITIAGPISLPAPNNYTYTWAASPPLSGTPNTKDLIANGSIGTPITKYVLTVKNGPCILKDSIKLEFLDLPVVQLPSDTDICGKNLYSVIVKPNLIDNSLNYFWSDGTVGPINTITLDGTYTLLANNKYCGSSDNYTITSRLKPVLNSLGPDKDFCNNDSINILLDPIVNYTAPPFQVLWSPGGLSTKSLTVKKPGTYIIRVGNGLNCEARDTIVITSTKVPQPIIPDSLFICGSGSFTVDASCNAQNYLWNTGSKDSVIVITESGYYTVEASNGKCKASDVLFVDKLAPFTVGSDFEFCPENENPTIEISNNTDAFTWSKPSDPTFTNPNPKRKLIVKTAGEYIASITKANCTLYDTVNIKTYKNQNVFIPNSFSPNNNDKLNQEYLIKATDVKDFNIKILTRFGQVLFESSDPKFTWDGKNKGGEKVMSGAYVYAISYKSYCSGDELFRENGILNVF